MSVVQNVVSETGEGSGARPTRRRRPFLRFGLLLITYAALNLVAFPVLAAAFGWPGILREPASAVLPAYAAQQSAINAGYYLFLVSSVLLIPIALGMRRILDPGDRTALGIYASFGVLTGVFQVLGWVRWPFTIPRLVELYTDPSSSAATRAAVEVAYESANWYAGVAVGEHLGFLFQAVFTVALGIFVLRLPASRALRLPRWLGWLGVVSGALFALADFGGFLVRGIGGGGLRGEAAAGADTLGSLFTPSYSVAILFIGMLGVALARLQRADV